MRVGLLAALVVALTACVPAQGARIVTLEIPSRFVDPVRVPLNGPPPGATAPGGAAALRANVLLPNGYRERGKRRFPVLYLLHGHGDTYAHWAAPSRGDVMRVAEGLGAIIVMPEGGRGWYTSWWNAGRRGEPAWERYHLEELIPAIERRFRVRSGRRFRAIAGLSMGGEGAMYYATQRPDYFGTVAAFSAPLSLQRPEWPAAFDTQGERHRDVFGDPEQQAFYWAGHNPVVLVRNLEHTRVYVTSGDGTPAKGEGLSNPVGALAEAELKLHADDFAAAASAHEVDVTYVPKAGIHDWPYWRDHLAEAIEWDLFDREIEDGAEIREWTFTTVSQHGRMWDVEFAFASPPGELIAFRRKGRQVKAYGSGIVTLRAPGYRPLTARLPFTRSLQVKPKPRRKNRRR